MEKTKIEKENIPKETITMEVSKDFYAWWQKQVCKHDKGLMFIAWSAWKACEMNWLSTKGSKNPLS